LQLGFALVYDLTRAASTQPFPQRLQVAPNPQLHVSPDRGHVAAESGAELELSLLPQQPGQFTATLEIEVRGSKPLKLPIRLACHNIQQLVGLLGAGGGSVHNLCS
jgi:hypothetical protein